MFTGRTETISSDSRQTPIGGGGGALKSASTSGLGIAARGLMSPGIAPIRLPASSTMFVSPVKASQEL